VKFDGDRSSFETGIPADSFYPSGVTPTRLQIADDGAVVLPDGELLTDALYLRVGDNLVIKSDDGEIYIVRDYFVLGDRPTLVSEDGGRLTPEMVDAFALNHDPVHVAQADGDFAPGAVAVVIVVDGTVTITRADGTVEVATVNSQIYENDVIEAAPDSGVQLLFIDETSIVLSDGGRLSVDEYVFDSSSGDGSSVFSVLKGMLAFVSGQIADNDPSDVMFNTPVASFGIRGTAAIADIQPPGILSSFTVIDGIIYVTNDGGTTVLDEQYARTLVENFLTAPSPATVITQEEFEEIYEAILSVFPDFFADFVFDDDLDVSPEAGPDTSPGSEGAGVNDGGTSQFVAFNESSSEDEGSGEGRESSGGGGDPSSGFPDGGGSSGGGGTGPGTDTVGTEVVFGDPPSDPGGPLNLSGTPGPDNLTGSSFDDVLAGNDGNDTVSGAAGNDLLSGDGGNDVVSGGPGGDTITGGDGNDLLTGGAGDDFVFGGGGNDTLVAGVGEGEDEYHGDAGVDVITYTSAINSLHINMVDGETAGGPEIGDDKFDGIENVTAGAGDDTIIGDGGDNVLDGSGGSDSIEGGAGNDSIVFDVNDAFVDGGAGTDSLITNGGNIDLTGITPGQFTGIELVDLSGNGSNTLILDAASLLALVGPGGSLQVVGDESDAVDIGPGWTITGTELVEGQTFLVYEQDGVSLLISNAIDQSNVDAVPTVSVSDGAPDPATEGTDGTITFTVTLSGPVNADVTVDFSTLDGTAIAGTDYTTNSGTLTFLAGEVSKDVTVTILNDAVFEDPEAFSLQISDAVFDPGGADTVVVIADDTGAGDVIDDDPLPTVSISDGAPGAATEGTDGTITFTVTLTNPAAFDVTVDFTTLNGTALAGSDYVLAAGTLTFLAGETSQDITVTVLDDAVFEDPEAFSLQISDAMLDPGGAATALDITDDTGAGNIADDDPVPTVSISDGAPDPATEGIDGTITFTVTLTNPAAFDVTVDFTTLDGTALAGSDYGATSGTLTFLAGETSKDITVTILDDSVFEDSEAFSVQISNATLDPDGAGTVVGITDDTGAGNIANDEPVPTVSIGPVDAQTDVTEGGVAAFRIFLEGGVTSTEAITVALSASDGTAGGGDYNNLQFFADADGTIPLTDNEATIAAGDTEVTIFVRTLDDTIVEGTEDYSLNIDGVVSGTATVGDASQTADIIDDDTATVSIGPVDAQTDVTEGGVAAFRIFLEGGVTSTEAITVALSASDGTAGGGDYNNLQFFADADGTIPLTDNEATIAAGDTEVTIFVRTLDDTIVEGTEDYSLNIDGVVSGTATVGDASQTADILDNDAATVSIGPVDAQTNVTEGGVAAFRIFLEGGVTSTEAITVALSATNGTAGNADYNNLQFFADADGTIPLTDNQATIAAGDTEVTVYVRTLDDTIVEGTEDYSLNIDGVVSGTATVGNPSQTADIIDNDTATVSIGPVDAQTDVTEGGVAAFRIFLEGGVTSTEAVTVALSATNGTAGNADYNNLQFFADADGTIPLTDNQATIAAGDTEVTVYVRTLDDTIAEGTEDYSLNIDGVVSGTATVGNPSQTADIIDNDAATVSIGPVDAQTNVTEGGVAAFRIFLEGGVTSAEDITVALSAADGTALGGAFDGEGFDYNNVQFFADADGTIPLTDNQATIAAGETEVTVFVRTFDDGFSENTEDYSLSIDSVVTTNATIGDANQTGLIFDDDAQPVVDLNGPEGGIDTGPVTYTADLGATSIVEADATVSDADSANLQSMTITLTNPLDGLAEILAVDTSGTGISAIYTPQTGVLSLTGVDTVANYQAVLRSLTYENTSEEPSEGLRTVDVVATDESGISSLIAQSTVDVDSQPTADAQTVTHDETPGEQVNTDDVAAIPAATLSALQAVFGDVPPEIGTASDSLSFSGNGGALASVGFDNITNLSATGLMSDEQPVLFFRISDTLYLGSTDVTNSGTATATAVFAIHIDADLVNEIGSATFVQFQPIDHPTLDPNEIESFTVDYTVTGTDADSTTNSITYEVVDDGPDASALDIDFTDVTHDETEGVQVAAGADDVSLDAFPLIFTGGAIGWAKSAITVDDSAAAVFGTDGAGTVELALTNSSGGTFTNAGLGTETNLSATEGGKVFLFEGPNGVVQGWTTDGNSGAAADQLILVFELFVDNVSGELQLAQHAAIFHFNNADPNDSVSLLDTNNEEALAFIAATVTDRDGDRNTNLFALGAGMVVFLDDAPAALADLNLAVTEGDADTSGTNLFANDTTSVDGVVVASIDYFDTDSLAQNATIAGGGDVTVQTQTGALTVASDGTWSFDADSNVNFGEGNSVTESFTYNTVDGDGDGSSAVQDVVINRQSSGGTAGDDTIFGTKGNDTLEGFTGNDLLFGLGGDDLYRFTAGDGDDTINDTSGTDTIQISAGRLGFATRQGSDLIIGYGLRGNADQITVEDHFSAGFNQEVEIIDVANQRPGGYVANILTGLTGTSANDLIIGTATDDTITGNLGHDFMSGGAGNDSLEGDLGEDTLIGGAGNDTLDGGSGDFDTAWYFGAPGPITVDLTLFTNQVTNDGTGGTDTLIDIDKIVGSNTGADSITGDSFANTIEGRGGNDTLIGGGGDDWYGIHIDGGRDLINDVSGSDTIAFHGAQLSSAERDDGTLIFRHSTDLANNLVAVQNGVGNNQIETIVTYDPSDPYGTPTGSYTFRVNLNATAGNDFLVGTGIGNASIEGGLGNDWLNGTFGNNDTLRGGDGNDVLVGDTFSDSMPGGADILDGGAGNDTYHFFQGSFAAGGADLVIDSAGVADTLTFFNTPLRTAVRIDGSLELRYSDNITGNRIVVQNQFQSNDAIEHIKLHDINDVFNTFVIYDIRSDTNSTSGNDFIVGVGPGNLSGETLSGGLGDDWLNGTDAGDDTLIGGPGTDFLVGMGGDDEYRIGAGDGLNFISELSVSSQLEEGGSDTLRYDGPAIIWWAVRTNDVDNDLRIEFNQFGSESVVIVDHFGANGAAVETLELASTGYTANIATGTTGTAGNDFIVGEDFFFTEVSETLNGGDGDDWVWAGGGGVPGNGDSVIGGIGNDTLVASEFGSDTLDGGIGNDFLSGEFGNNTLLGGAGNDTLDGGGGIDSLDGGAQSDFVSYEFTDGSNGNFAVTIDLANNQATDFEGNTDTLVNIENAIGSIQGDTIIGDAGINELIGAAGGDTMTGGASADTFTWRAQSDLDFDFNGLIDGIDELTDFSGAGEGDLLDISQLLSDLGASQVNVDSFFQTVIDGGDNSKVNLQVDFSGNGTNWQTFATVNSGDGLVGGALELDVDNNINFGFP